MAKMPRPCELLKLMIRSQRYGIYVREDPGNQAWEVMKAEKSCRVW